MGWQWHQLDHMQIICTLLQTHNHASTSRTATYLPAAQQQRQSTAKVKNEKENVGWYYA